LEEYFEGIDMRRRLRQNMQSIEIPVNSDPA
jgi:hypothetical protein